jgi:hypothetical protein
MKSHDTYQYVLMPEDLDESQQEGLTEMLASEFDWGQEAQLEINEAKPVTLVLPERIPTNDKPAVRELFADHIDYELDSFERIILELHVTWPTPGYQICIGFQ